LLDLWDQLVKMMLDPSDFAIRIRDCLRRPLGLGVGGVRCFLCIGCRGFSVIRRLFRVRRLGLSVLSLLSCGASGTGCNYDRGRQKYDQPVVGWP
jgi:hypothetical protein